MKIQYVSGFGSALVFALLVGCSGSGKDTVPVSGTVTFRGEPVEGANVAFFSENGRPATGRTDALDGFTLSTFERGDGAVPGMHKVAISDTQDEVPPTPGFAEAEKWEPAASRFPARYEAPETSGFTANVQPAGTNDFVFEMTEE